MIRGDVRFIVVLSLIHTTKGITCYQCYLTEQPYYLSVKVKTCKEFDYSSDFLKDCPESTFCYKKTSKDRFYGTEYVGEERGCAPQTYVGQKQDNFGIWTYDEHVVNNAYEEGCHEQPSFGLRSTRVEECFCKSNLCNSGTKLVQVTTTWLLLLNTLLSL